MPVGDFLAGIAFLALAAGSALFFAWVVVTRRLAGLGGAPRLVAFGVLALLGFFAVHLVPGALGLLGNAAVSVASVLLIVGSTRVRPARPAGNELALIYPPGAPPSGRVSWALAGAGAAIYATNVLALAIDQGGDAVRTVDMNAFHLPNIARWIQTGSLWHVTDFVVWGSFGAYPNTSDVMTLGLILPFRNDFLVHFVNYPMLALAGVGIYALARELAAPAAPAALFAAALLAMPAVTEIAFDGLADTLMIATFASGLLFLLRRQRTGALSDLVLAGVALGLCVGTKWYALPAVIAATLGWAALMWWTRRDAREAVAGVGVLGGLGVAIGGFWLLRNLVVLGDPFFPVRVRAAGVTIFDASRDLRRELTGQSLAHYLGDTHLWRYFRHLWWPTFLEFMSWVAVALWLALPLGGVLAWLRRRTEADSSRRVIAAVAISAGIGLVYLITPYTAQGARGVPLLAAANARYAIPALVLGAAVGAWTTGCLGRLRVVAEAVLLLALLDGVRRTANVSATALVAAALVVAAALWALERFELGHVPSLRTPGMAAALACAALVSVAALAIQERRFNGHRYTDSEGTASYVTRHAPAGHRIGVAGEGFIVYPMFGPRLRNHVEYVGPRIKGMLRAYRRPGEFKAALARGHYDLVLLQGADFVERGLTRLQARWLGQMGYRVVATGVQRYASGETVRLYRAPS